MKVSMNKENKMLKVPSVHGFEDLDRFAADSISTVNWDSFPYCPSVTFRIGHSEDRLFIRYDVDEANAKAVSLESNGPVWEDSCVEFFVRIPGDEHYFNFETNCIGTGLAAKRLSRQDFKHFTPEQMSQVIRRPSLPHEACDIKDCSWSLEFELPFSILGCTSCPDRLLANFYKCGDKTAVKHFVSWNPIINEKPDFHRPEFFGELILL